MSASFPRQLKELLVLQTTRKVQRLSQRFFGSKNPAPSAKRVKQSLKARRATRRARKTKQKFKTQRVVAQIAGETKQHSLGSEKLCTKMHKRRKPVMAWSLNLKRRTDYYILWFISFHTNVHSRKSRARTAWSRLVSKRLRELITLNSNWFTRASRLLQLSLGRWVAILAYLLESNRFGNPVFGNLHRSDYISQFLLDGGLLEM